MSLRPLRSLLLVAAVLSMAACGAPPLRVTQGEVASAGGARVILHEIIGDIFKLTVVNESSDAMVIYRDRVTARLPTGIETRMPGGASNLYTVRPGESHALNAEFELEGLKDGDEVWILLNDAVTIKGKPVVLQPLKTVVAR